MKTVRLEAALIDAMDMSPADFENQRYMLFRQASYIAKQMYAPSTRLVRLLSSVNGVIKLPEAHLATVKVLRGDLLNLNEGEDHPFLLHSHILDQLKSIPFSDQDEKLVVSSDESFFTIIYDGLIVDGEGEPMVPEICLPAVTAYILWMKIKKAKFKAAMTSSQAYYIIRDQEASLRREYEAHIINALAEMRLSESEMKDSNPLIQRFNDN